MADKDRIQIIEDRFNALFNNIKPRTYNGDYNATDDISHRNLP